MATVVPPKMIFFPLNTNRIRVDGLQDADTLVYWDNTATVSATLVNQYDKSDPVFQNIGLTFVAASNGSYEGLVPATFDAEIGTGYTVKIDGVQGGGVIHLEIPAEVKARTR